MRIYYIHTYHIERRSAPRPRPRDTHTVSHSLKNSPFFTAAEVNPPASSFSRRTPSALLRK